MTRPTRFLFMTLLCSVSSAVPSQTPLSPGFTYQGHLNQNGVPVDGAVNLRFSLWDAATNGAQIGTSLPIADVPVANGVFTVLLNASGEFGPTAFNGEARWLQIEVCNNAACDTPTLLDPRQEITAAPYALHALSAHWDGLTGVPAGFADNVDNSGDSLWGNDGNNIFYSNGNVGVGGAASNTDRLLVTGGEDLDTAAFGSTSKGPNVSHIQYGPLGDWYIRSAASSGKVILQDSGGNVGIGTPNPAYPLTLNTGASGHGFVHTDGAVEVGSFINAAGGWLGTKSNHPLHFFTNNSFPKVTLTTDGKVGIGTASPQVDTLLNVVTVGDGVQAIRGNSTNGNGVIGTNERGGFSATGGVNYAAVDGIGVYGEANTGFGSRGVWGQANQGTGVYGASASAQGAESAGVFGRNTAASGTGVIGEANAGGLAYGVWGKSTQGRGVVGEGGAIGVEAVSTTQSGRALYVHGPGFSLIEGDVDMFGQLNLNGNDLKYDSSIILRIDHPLDPSESYLQLPGVQSTDMKNILDGNVVTDNQGYATVVLPDWFETANRDFRYQLTVIGQFSQSIVSKEIENNSFEIQTDKPNVKVSWLVTGVRNDAYAKANPIEVEKLKSPKERGKYLAPELYGQPKEKGIHYQADLEKVSSASKSIGE